MAQVNFRMDDGLKAQADAESFRKFAAENTINVPADFKWSRAEANEREIRMS